MILKQSIDFVLLHYGYSWGSRFGISTYTYTFFYKNNFI